jgi:hypothetical protein
MTAHLRDDGPLPTSALTTLSYLNVLADPRLSETGDYSKRWFLVVWGHYGLREALHWQRERWANRRANG